MTITTVCLHVNLYAHRRGWGLGAIGRRYRRPMEQEAANVSLSVLLTPSSPVEVQTYRTLHESLQMYLTVRIAILATDDGLSGRSDGVGGVAQNPCASLCPSCAL